MNDTIKNAFDKIANISTFVAENCNNAYTAQYMDDILAIVREAVSEPLKNCNVGTAEEQIERHHKTYCREYNSTPTCLAHNDSCALCFARWSQTPYNNDKRGSDDDNK